MGWESWFNACIMSECYVMLTYVIVALSSCDTVSVTMLKSPSSFTILLSIIWPFSQLELHQNVLSWVEKSFTFFTIRLNSGAWGAGFMVSISTLLDFAKIEFQTSWWSYSSQFTIRKLFDDYLSQQNLEIFMNISSSLWILKLHPTA